MALADYEIVVLNVFTGAVRRVIDSQSFYDLKYDRALNDVGTLVMTLPATDDFLMLFPKDTFIEIRRTSPITGDLIVEDTYLTRFTQRFRENNEERFVVGGYSLNHLIARRIIDPAGLGSSAGGFSTKSGVADEVIRAFAREQMADLATTGRSFPGLTINTTPGTGLPIGKRVRYENLLTVFQDLAVQGQTDFVITRYSGASMRMFIQPIGTDRTRTSNYPFAEFTQFDPDRGNLANPSLTIDAKQEQNFCYALGQGQGDTRIVALVPGDNLSESPFNRIEFTQDVRQSDRSDSLYLLTGGRTALTQKQETREFTFDTVQNASGALYRRDYDLGDKITVAWGDVSIDLRVTGIQVDLDSSGEVIKPKLEPFNT